MSSDPIMCSLKLNCHSKTYKYNINWDINNEGGDDVRYNVLHNYSRMAKQDIFRSGKILCTSGPFVGAEKYLEFFLLANTDNTYDVFTKMSYPQTNSNDNEDSGLTESFSFSNACYRAKLYQNGSTEPSLFRTTYESGPTQWLPTFIAKEGLIALQKRFPNKPVQEHTYEKWAEYGFRIYSSSTHNVKKLCFEIGILFERWGKLPLPEDEYLESDITSRQGQLNTNDLLFSSTWSDVTVNCGDKSFPAHILILQNTSSVLRAMFSQPMIENLTRKLTITDFEPETVEEFLRFIYTGTVTDMAKNVVGLFGMAEKYDVQNLKIICENFILANISDENVLERYQVGNLLNSKKITSKCIRKIKKNKKTIWKTEEEFSESCQKFPKLFYELFCN